MDVNLPDVSGVECVARLAPKRPGTQIIMRTVFQDTDTIFKALEAGAHGYLVKPVMPGCMQRICDKLHVRSRREIIARDKG